MTLGRSRHGYEEVRADRRHDSKHEFSAIWILSHGRTSSSQ
jgi:hypothetical protein